MRNEPTLTSLLTSAIRYSPTVFDVTIADSEGRCLLSTDPNDLDRLLPQRPEYAELENGGLLRLLAIVFGPPRVYNVSLPLERSGQPFATVRVGIRTTFLRFVVEPWLIAALTYTGIAILCSLIVAAFLANLALKPIEQIGYRLDALDRQAMEPAGELEAANRSQDAVVLVSNKIERLGRRMRNVEEVFSALKEGLDQIMTNLQDGIVLFTRDARAVLVSDSVERFLGINRRRSWAPSCMKSSAAIPAWEAWCGNPSTRAWLWCRKRLRPRPGGTSKSRWTSSMTTRAALLRRPGRTVDSA